eukprot:3739851-Alexandrium_andersonii.AAC.1
MDRHGLKLDDLGRSELHAGFLARAATLLMAVGPARLRVQQPCQNVSGATRHGAVPICRLGVVDVLSEDGLARVCV